MREPTETHSTACMPSSVTAEAPAVVEMGSMRPSPFANSVEPLEEEAPLLVSEGDT